MLPPVRLVLTGRTREHADNVTEPDESPEKRDPTQIPVDVRMCRDCKRTVFSKSDFQAELSAETADQRAFNNLKQFERGIRTMLPRFQKLLTTLQYETSTFLSV